MKVLAITVVFAVAGVWCAPTDSIDEDGAGAMAMERRNARTDHTLEKKSIHDDDGTRAVAIVTGNARMDHNLKKRSVGEVEEETNIKYFPDLLLDLLTKIKQQAESRSSKESDIANKIVENTKLGTHTMIKASASNGGHELHADGATKTHPGGEKIDEEHNSTPFVQQFLDEYHSFLHNVQYKIFKLLYPILANFDERYKKPEVLKALISNFFEPATSSLNILSLKFGYIPRLHHLRNDEES